MDSALLISTGGAILGTAVGAVVGAVVASTIGNARADREEAKRLLTRVQTSVTVMHTEIESFYERRGSRAANARAIGNLLMGVMAGWREDGKWMTAAAKELHTLRDWDLGEGDRLLSRLLPAMSEFSAALVLLALLDREIRDAALPLSENAKLLETGDQQARKNAVERLDANLVELGLAVERFLHKRGWRRAFPRWPRVSISRKGALSSNGHSPSPRA